MKLCKYYSLDECHDKDTIFEKLENLLSDSKLEYEYFKDDEVIKIKNTGLSLKEKKDLIYYFKDNDVIDYPDYEEFLEEEDFDDDEEEDDEFEY